MALVELRADRGVSEKTEFVVQKNSKAYSNLGFSSCLKAFRWRLVTGEPFREAPTVVERLTVRGVFEVGSGKVRGRFDEASGVPHRTDSLRLPG